MVVSGRFGIGRTSLIKHIAHAQDELRFVFIDFSKPPGHMCKHLLTELFPKQKYGRKYVKYKSGRFQIMTLELEDRRKHVIVLDNIARLTFPKLDLVRYLNWESRFLFICIVEHFLPQDDLFQLRTWLNPCMMINLQRLNMQNGIEFFQCFSVTSCLNWTERQITNLAATAGGYPLRMKEIATRELERCKSGKPSCM